MIELSAFRLNLLRAVYLLITVGLVFSVWPQLFSPPKAGSLWRGVGCSLLAAVSILTAAGIRYPLTFLPILFFEMIWKSIWLVFVAYPLWSSGQMDAANSETARDCLTAIIIPIVIPWRYVWMNYVKKKADKWR